MKDEALKLALEALEICEQDGYIPVRLTRDAITAIKQARALDKMADNARELGLDYEPVGCMRCATPKKCATWGCSPNTWPSENTTPPNVATPLAAQRQWVGLTRQQINQMMADAGWQNSAIRQADLDKVEKVAQAIEAKLKEKNT